MKSSIKFFSVVLLILFTACTKEDVKLDTSTLPGKWKLSESYISNGAIGTWEQSKATVVVEFKVDGSLAGNAYPQYASYSIKDASTITLLRADKTEQNYAYQLKDGLLTMSPSGPITCIEGCADRFKKIK
jgi:hypothetical protein